MVSFVGSGSREFGEYSLLLHEETAVPPVREQHRGDPTASYIYISIHTTRSLTLALRSSHKPSLLVEFALTPPQATPPYVSSIISLSPSSTAPILAHTRPPHATSGKLPCGIQPPSPSASLRYFPPPMLPFTSSLSRSPPPLPITTQSSAILPRHPPTRMQQSSQFL